MDYFYADIWDVLYDFLDDDINFFLFLYQADICKKKEITNLNIDLLSKTPLPYDFIIKFQHNLNWKILTASNAHNINFITTFEPFIDWNEFNNIGTFKNFKNYDIFKRFHAKMNWKEICRWAYMYEDFIDEFYRYVDWDILINFQCLTDNIKEKYHHYIKLHTEPKKETSNLPE